MKCFAPASVVAATLILHVVGNCHAFVAGSNGRAVHSFSTTTRRNTDYSSSSPSRLFLEPLAQEGDWAAYLDEQNTGLVYYFNAATGESLWVPPTPTFPLVSLNPNQSKLAQTKQREYQASAVSATTTTSTVTTTATSAAVQNDKVVEKEGAGGGPFGFFNRKKKEDSPADDTPLNTNSVETKKRRFGLGVIKSVLSRSNQDGDANGSVAPVAKKALVVDAIVKPSPSSTPTTTDTASLSSAVEVDVAAYVLPHPAKVRWGGEDAVFVKGRNFGVFDGVSGAEKLDGVPLYSLTLAKEMKALVSKDDVLSFPQMTKILTEAAEYADKSATGASTAVVGSLSDGGELTVLNLGDSLCVVVRDGKIVAKTKEIVHYFDCPYQLSEDSPDRPKDGTRLTIKVQKGDLIVMGSDGIFDNLKDSEICDLCVSNCKLRAATISRKIVDQSRRVSLDSKADTPYAKLAMRNKDPDYSNGLGGKVDDASCIVVKCS